MWVFLSVAAVAAAQDNHSDVQQQVFGLFYLFFSVYFSFLFFYSHKRWSEDISGATHNLLNTNKSDEKNCYLNHIFSFMYFLPFILVFISTHKYTQSISVLILWWLQQFHIVTLRMWLQYSIFLHDRTLLIWCSIIFSFCNLGAVGQTENSSCCGEQISQQLPV